MPPCPIRVALDVELPVVEILDVGAMLEGTERYASLVAQSLARVTGFEPNPAELDRLRATKRGPYRYLPYFLGRGGPARFHVTRYPGCSSLYAPDPTMIDLFATIGAGPGGNFQVREVIPVETRRLDDIADCPPPDYIKIDVQGAELDVLEGGTTALQHALVVELEAEFVPLYRDQPLFGDIQTFLWRRGFVLHKLLDVGGRCFRPVQLNGNPFRPISQLLWADAVFVRDFRALDRFTDDELLKVAAVLHEAYCSYDLVLRFLLEYDRRRHADLANRYVGATLSGQELPTMCLNLRLQP
jgi:FkbM family methyltransferase